MLKIMNRTVYVLFLVVLLMSTAKAEEKYNHQNLEHKADVVCIASLSIGRDIFSPAGIKPDTEICLALTDLQNNLYLKYDYSSQMSKHIDTRKMLIMNTWTTDQLNNQILGCRGRA